MSQSRGGDEEVGRHGEAGGVGPRSGFGRQGEGQDGGGADGAVVEGVVKGGAVGNANKV